MENIHTFNFSLANHKYGLSRGFNQTKTITQLY